MRYILIILILFALFNKSKAADVVLTTQNACSLVEEVNSNSMATLKACLAEKVILRKGRKTPIYLVIDSPGGSVYDGIKFISFAKTIDNLQTVTIFAASMASAVVEQLPGKRHMMEHGVYMFHRARGQVSGQFEDGELESRLAMWKKIVRGMEQKNADRIGITLKEYKNKVVNEWWLYGDDAVKANVADKVSSVVCSKQLAAKQVKRKVYTFLGAYDVTESACPLMN